MSLNVALYNVGHLQRYPSPITTQKMGITSNRTKLHVRFRGLKFPFNPLKLKRAEINREVWKKKQNEMLGTQNTEGTEWMDRYTEEQTDIRTEGRTETGDGQLERRLDRWTD